MKKLYLLSLLLPLWGIAYSQSCVAVRQVSTNYATQQITFDLTWGTCNNTTHLNKAWVFVDYQTITGTTRGAWAPATIVGTPTVSNGTYAAGNSRGFYVTGVNGQTATVTVTLSNVPAQFNWCAYATDYPPNAKISGNSYTLHGTAPFTVNGIQLGTGVRTYSGACITSITDPTGCPGLLPAAPTVTTTNPAAVCAGSGVTLVATPGGGTTTANTYTWNIGGASTTTTTNTFAVPPASITTSKTFTVSVTNANKCVSNTASGSITIKPLPAPTISGGNASIVAGTATTWTANIAGGTWSSNNTSVATVNNGVITGNITGTATITYRVTQNGCTGTVTRSITVVTNCNTSNITFTSGFTSSQTWVVGSQTWSAPVTATYCRKTSFNGGTTENGPYFADCRANNGTSTAVNTTYGDLFSGCMVSNFAATICPSGWRVPTLADFCSLDKALFSTTTCTNRVDASSLSVYMGSLWGGRYSGNHYIGILSGQEWRGDYWSLTAHSEKAYHSLRLDSSEDIVHPQTGFYKNAGLALRCVKVK